MSQSQRQDPLARETPGLQQTKLSTVFLDTKIEISILFVGPLIGPSWPQDPFNRIGSVPKVMQQTHTKSAWWTNYNFIS